MAEKVRLAAGAVPVLVCHQADALSTRTNKQTNSEISSRKHTGSRRRTPPAEISASGPHGGGRGSGVTEGRLPSALGPGTELGLCRDQPVSCGNSETDSAPAPTDRRPGGFVLPHRSHSYRPDYQQGPGAETPKSESHGAERAFTRETPRMPRDSPEPVAHGSPGRAAHPP